MIVANSKNTLVKIFVFFMVLEAVLLVIFGIIKNDIGLSIVSSVLSGTIVGLLVTYSQAKISASLYEESRLKSRHLDDIKSFLNGKNTDALANIMISRDEHKKEFSDLEDIGIHWTEFYKSLCDLSKIEKELGKNDDEIKELKNDLSNNIQEIIDEVNQEIEKGSHKENFLTEFFQPGQNLSSINLNGNSHSFNTSKKLSSLFTWFIGEIIMGVEQELTNGKKVSIILQSKVPDVLTAHESQFHDCIDKKLNECQSVIALFWNDWTEIIGRLANRPLHSATNRARLTKISDLTSVPNVFATTVKKSIQSVLIKDKRITKIIELIENRSYLVPKRTKFISDVQEQKLKIENSYLLKGNCSRIKE